MPFDRLAVAAEERGIGHVAVAHHMHEPVGSATQATPDYFKNCLDPWVALTAAAVATTRVRLGTCVYLMAQNHPLVTAKAVASLDFLSGGRIDLGVGWGWNRAEAYAYGVEWLTRRARLREHVMAARNLWSSDVAEFHGEFVDFGPSWQFPKPVQPHIPVIVGCMQGPRNFAEIAACGDGWYPVHSLVEDPATSVKALHNAAEDAGRDPRELSVRVCNLPATLEGAGRWRDVGATHAFALLPGDITEDDAKRRLDKVAHAAQGLG